MNMLTRPSTPETVDKAIAIENAHIKSYKEWALRIRTFSPELSVTLQAQTEEMEEHRNTLVQHAGNCTYETLAPAGVFTEDKALKSGHFFIIDSDTANTVLTNAIELKQEARDFYKNHTRNELDDSSLIKLYKSLCSYKEVHIQILLEAQDRFLARYGNTRRVSALG